MRCRVARYVRRLVSSSSFTALHSSKRRRSLIREVNFPEDEGNSRLPERSRINLRTGEVATIVITHLGICLEMDTRVEQWPSLISHRLISNKRLLGTTRYEPRFVIVRVNTLLSADVTNRVDYLLVSSDVPFSTFQFLTVPNIIIKQYSIVSVLRFSEIIRDVIAKRAIKLVSRTERKAKEMLAIHAYETPFLTTFYLRRLTFRDY